MPKKQKIKHDKITGNDAYIRRAIVKLTWICVPAWLTSLQDELTYY
jgi:hypothetical protein